MEDILTIIVASAITALVTSLLLRPRKAEEAKEVAHAPPSVNIAMPIHLADLRGGSGTSDSAALLAPAPADWAKSPLSDSDWLGPITYCPESNVAISDSTPELWASIVRSCEEQAALEPCLRPWFEMALLRHPCLESALCTILAQRFASPEMPAREWRRACEDVLLHPPPGYDEKNAKNCATNSCISPDGTKKTSKSSKIKCCSSDGNGKTSNNNNSSSGCSGGGGGSSSQNSSCENLAFVAVESLKATASMESFSAMAALAEARANEWPPVEGEWQVPTLLRADLAAVTDRDPACIDAAHCLMHFKGFLSLASHRVAHVLWQRGRRRLAVAFQSRCSEVFAMDLHPAATIGKGVMFDHGTGIVVGETAKIGDECSLLHGVTLGGTGKRGGRDRHPKLGNQVLVGAHASILGNICIGSRAKIGCGSVVLASIPSGATAVGAPAKVVGRASEAAPGRESDNALMSVDATKPTPAHFAPPASSSSSSTSQHQQHHALYSHMRHARVRSSGGARSDRERSRASGLHGGGDGAASGSESTSSSASNGGRRSMSFSGPESTSATASSGGRTSTGLDSGLNSGLESGSGDFSLSPVNDLVFGNFQAKHSASSAVSPDGGGTSAETVEVEMRQNSSTPPRAPPPSFRTSSPPAAAPADIDSTNKAVLSRAMVSGSVPATVRWNVNVGHASKFGVSSKAKAEFELKAGGGAAGGGSSGDARMVFQGNGGEIEYEEEEAIHHHSSNAWTSSHSGSGSDPVWASWRSIWRHLDSAQEGFLTAPQFHERLAAHGHSMNEAQVDELFFALDQDNDGVVSEAEFLAASALLPPVTTGQTASSDSDSDFGHHVDFAVPGSGGNSGHGNGGNSGNNTGSSSSSSPSSTAGISTASASSDEEVVLANGSKRISSIRSLQELFSDNTNGEAT